MLQDKLPIDELGGYLGTNPIFSVYILEFIL